MLRNPATEQKIVELSKNGMSAQNIANEIGMSLSVVYKIRAEHGLQTQKSKTKPKPKISDEQIWQIKKLSDEGLSTTEIAKRVGVSKNTVFYRQRMIGDFRSVRHFVSDEEILKLTKDGLSASEIAKRIDCTSSAVIKHQKKLGIHASQIPVPPITRPDEDANWRIEVEFSDASGVCFVKNFYVKADSKNDAIRRVSKLTDVDGWRMHWKTIRKAIPIVKCEVTPVPAEEPVITVAAIEPEHHEEEVSMEETRVETVVSATTVATTLNIRIPKSLYKSLQIQAELEGVDVEQYCTYILTRMVMEMECKK